MSARNSGTGPVKSLFDKSLSFDENKISITVDKPKQIVSIIHLCFLLTVLVDWLDSEWQAELYRSIRLKISF